MRKPKIENKLYIIRQYIFAKSAKEALSLAKKHEFDECWVDTEWFSQNLKNKEVTPAQVGFFKNEK